MVVWLWLAVVGLGAAVGQEGRAVDRPDAARLSLDSYPPAGLVLMGDDDDVVGHRWLTLQRLSYPDEILDRAVACPHGQDVASCCWHSWHGGPPSAQTAMVSGCSYASGNPPAHGFPAPV